jgi:hypothetical protein
MDDFGVRISTDRVHQIAVPPPVRALSTLSDIDYEDAFLVRSGPDQERTAEQWAREVLEGASIAVRAKLLSGWSALGLKLRSSGPSVLGWPVRVNTPEFMLLGADSRIGMPGQLLFKREHDALLFCTFVQHDGPIAHRVWAAVEPAHVRIVRDILEQARRRLCP